MPYSPASEETYSVLQTLPFGTQSRYIQSSLIFTMTNILRFELYIGWRPSVRYPRLVRTKPFVGIPKKMQQQTGSKCQVWLPDNYVGFRWNSAGLAAAVGLNQWYWFLDPIEI